MRYAIRISISCLRRHAHSLLCEKDLFKNPLRIYTALDYKNIHLGVNLGSIQSCIWTQFWLKPVLL